MSECEKRKKNVESIIHTTIIYVRW